MKFKKKFKSALFRLYEKHPVFEWFLCLLCEIEMQIRFLNKGTEFRNDMHMEGFKTKLPNETWEEFENREVFTQIPEKSLYCEGCPYWDKSSLANFFFGNQSNGFCYYLNKGDFSYMNSTMILWDMCKECGRNEDIDIDITGDDE